MVKTVCVVILCFFMTSEIYSKEISLLCSNQNWKSLIFEDKKSTSYSCTNSEYVNVVSESASAKIYILNDVIRMEKFRLQWQITSGRIATKNAVFERTKSGDDFLLRIGLIILGQKPWIPIFSPSWIKYVNSILKFPSDRMDYYVLTPFSASGDVWKSPYTNSIRNIAWKIDPSQFGSWREWNTKLEASLNVVGFWMMSDGDDTKSTFEIRLKDFVVEYLSEAK